MTINQNKYWIITILLIGFLLRLYELSYQSIWLDEALSVYYSQMTLTQILSLKGNTPPLYYLLLNIWINIMGSSEFSLRLLSVFLSTLSVFIMYLIGATMFNKKAGIYSAVLLALSPVHIYYAQEARSYSLLFLLTLLSMFFYLKLRVGFSKRFICGYVVSSVLLIYSHHYGILILLAQNVHQLIINNFKDMRKLKPWILLQTAILILYSPWLLQLPDIISNHTYSWIPRPNALILFPLIYKFTAGEVLSFTGLFLTFLYVFVVFRYPFSLAKKELVILLPWLLIPIILPFTYSLFFTPIFQVKYALIASLPLYLLVSCALFNMTLRSRRILISLVVLLSVTGLYIQQSSVTKDPWKDVSKYIRSNIQENDNMIFINSYEVMPFLYYYSPNCLKGNDYYYCASKRRIYPINSVEQIKQFNKERTWLIISGHQYISNLRTVLNYVHDNYDVVKSEEFLLNKKTSLFQKFSQFLSKIGFLDITCYKIEAKYLIKKHDQIAQIESY